MLNSISSTFAGVVLDSIDYQMNRDFSENKGVFVVGATNINIYDKKGNYRGSLNQAPMPDFKTIDAFRGYSTLVHPGYSIGVAHNIKPSPVNYFGNGEIAPDNTHLYTGIITPDERGGLVCLNSLWRFVKWISAFVMLPPLLI